MEIDTTSVGEDYALGFIFVGAVYLARAVEEVVTDLRARPTRDWLDRFEENRRSRGLRAALEEDLALTVVNRGAQACGLAFEGISRVVDTIDYIESRYKAQVHVCSTQ